jgi:hypothetical protein
MKKQLILVASILLLTGCSVYKASDLQGATVEDPTKCTNKDCFLGLGAQALENKTNADGTTDVVYKVKRKNGNAGRAIMYGVADLFTLGLWEIVGTPLEGYVSDNDSIVFKVTYAPTGAVNKVTVQGK